MHKPIHTIQAQHRKKKLIVFDLDGTLTKSKADMDKEMAALLAKLLEKKKVAIIGGGRYQLFRRQLLSKLDVPKTLLKNLFLFPTTAATFYRHSRNNWHRVYAKKISKKEKNRIFSALDEVLAEFNCKSPHKIYGELIDDRDTEITFSALGQKAPLRLKEKWKEHHGVTKLKMTKALQKKLPDLEVHAAGFTSIDVKHRGIDNEYGLKQIRKYLHVPLSAMLFVGDALFPGGNDAAALRTGVPCVEVGGPEDTKRVIVDILS